jgi:chromosome segregation ATPase
LKKNQVDSDNLKEQLHDLEEKLASEKDKEKEMNEKLRKYAHESEVLQNKLNQQQFGYEKFISNDSKMIFYPGLSRKQFNALWEFIEPELSTPIRKDISQKMNFLLCWLRVDWDYSLKIWLTE